MKKLFGVPSDADGFIGKIVDIFEGLTSEAGANWYDFGVGMGSIALLVLLKELKLRSANWPWAQKGFLSKVIWFLGTAKAAIVTILMMCIAIGIEYESGHVSTCHTIYRMYTVKLFEKSLIEVKLFVFC